MIGFFFLFLQLMRIAILTSGILPVPATKGGAVENLIDFYLEYNNQHHLHDITVYSIDDVDAMHHPALQSEVNHYHFIDVRSFGAKIRKNFLHLLNHEEYYHYTIEYYFEQSLKYIADQNYDMIIIENRPGYGLKIPQEYPAKVVYHIHNDFLNAQTKSAEEIYERADGIITVSNYIRERVRTVYALDKKTKVIHNGIDLSAFSAQQETHRHTLGLSDDDFVLLFSGRINHEKGISELIDAMNLLKDEPAIKLMVIGSSFYGITDFEDEYLTTLKEKASALSNRIIFTGFVPYKQMPQYLKMADVAVIPSIWDDPFPTTVLEAQAMGVPVISTHRGGIPEEVTPETAILLDTEHHFVDHLTNAILDLYNHPEKRLVMSNAALEHSKQFSKEKYAQNFFEAIESIK